MTRDVSSMPYQDAQQIVSSRVRARSIILQAYDNVECTRLRRPDRPTDDEMSVVFWIDETREYIVMTGTESGDVKIERTEFDSGNFRPLRPAVTVGSIDDAMNALSRLLED